MQQANRYQNAEPFKNGRPSEANSVWARAPTDISRTDRYPRIVKGTGRRGLCPNLADYEQMRREFNWEVARALLDGLPGGRGLNIAHEAVDRHADGPRAERHALRWIGRTGNQRVFTYRDLKAATNRFANALRNLGVQEGDSVFVFRRFRNSTLQCLDP